MDIRRCTATSTSGVTRGTRGDTCPGGQHFGGAKLRSKCYALITKCQMSADTNNYDLENVECQQMLRSSEISSRSPWFAKREIMNLSDVSKRSFCLQQSAPAYGLTHGCVTMLSDSQSCELSDFILILHVRHKRLGQRFLTFFYLSTSFGHA